MNEEVASVDEKRRDILERTFRFSVRIVKRCQVPDQQSSVGRTVSTNVSSIGKLDCMNAPQLLNWQGNVRRFTTVAGDIVNRCSSNVAANRLFEDICIGRIGCTSAVVA